MAFHYFDVMVFFVCGNMFHELIHTNQQIRSINISNKCHYINCIYILFSFHVKMIEMLH